MLWYIYIFVTQAVTQSKKHYQLTKQQQHDDKMIRYTLSF